MISRSRCRELSGATQLRTPQPRPEASALVRRLVMTTAAWVMVLALFGSSTAAAQSEESTDEAPVEIVGYGDAELIQALRTYGLLDEWTAASPVSPQASLLQVTGNGNYQSQRQAFLNSLQTWADRTEAVRIDLSRLDTAQANADQMRAAIQQVWDALESDDRLASDSQTLVDIADALAQLAALPIPEHSAGHSQDSLTLAEVELAKLREQANVAFAAVNDRQAAFNRSGTEAFSTYWDLNAELRMVDQLIQEGRKAVTPARVESERLISSTVDLIPGLHSARMAGSTDVSGLSVATVDAYIRGAARASCGAVDWALLAGIGKIESNHGRIGGASVSRSGQVSTTILGPLLDGGATERENAEANGVNDEQRTAVVQVARRAAQPAFGTTLSGVLRRIAGVDDQGWNFGNGFAIVVDSDDGRLDGNDEWDRAIGPMQFLPETWSNWATDGNGDGFADPHNLYDAAASAARFLCHLSETRGSSPSSFILGYNASGSYVRSVISTAQGLRARSLPST